VIATDYLRLGVEQYLRELTDNEFSQLVSVVRPPNNTSSATEFNRKEV
jgi:hypothetical protein